MTANDVLLVMGAIVFSLFAFLFVYLVVTKKLSKAWIAAAVFLELIVIWALIEKQPAFLDFPDFWHCSCCFLVGKEGIVSKSNNSSDCLRCTEVRA